MINLSKMRCLLAGIFVTTILSASAKPNLPADDLYTGAITGHITTADQRPAKEVPVILVGTNKTAYTNEDGNFYFRHIKAGNYVLQVSVIGFGTVRKSLSVEEGKTADISLQLHLSASQLAEVVITSHVSPNEQIPAIGNMNIPLRDLPQAATLIDREVMDRQQVHSLGDVLKNVPGIYVMGETGGVQQEIGGRGYVFTSSNTLKNGMQYNNSLMPEVSGLESVEFLKGSAAILGGDVSAGGVLNLVTNSTLTSFKANLPRHLLSLVACAGCTYRTMVTHPTVLW